MKDILQVLILIVGATFTARSFFLGIFASWGLVLFLRRGAGLFFKIAAGSCCALFFSLLLLPESLSTKIDQVVFPWLFEWYYNFVETGELKTRSSEAVLKLHHYALPAKTILLGDGRMTMHGAPFLPHLNSDAGYMRVLGFGGIFYLVASIIFQVMLLSPLRRLKTHNAKIMFWLLLVMLLLFQIKGDVFGSLTVMPCCLFLLGLCVDGLSRQRVRGGPLPRHPLPLPPGFRPYQTPWVSPPAREALSTAPETKTV
jgi:hypothetical protein